MVTSLNANNALAILASFVLSLGFTHWARRRFAEGGFQDHATSRSLHLGVTPKVGGLGLLPSVCLSLLVDFLLGRVIGEPQTRNVSRSLELLIWIAPAFLVYVVCVLNDRKEAEIPAGARLVIFLMASMSFVGLAFYLSTMGNLETLQTSLPIPSIFSSSLRTVAVLGFVTLSVLAFTNFFNFMDGLDGLAGSMGLIGFATLGIAALHAPTILTLGVAALTVSASCLGFLCWNWPKAMVFMGDTGSTFLGFSAASLGWIGSLSGQWHWSFPFLVFFPFWFDASVTLIRRLIRGEKIWQAHREHFYQRAVLSLERFEMSERHLRVLIPSITLMLISSGVALAQHLNWFGLRQNQPWTALATLTLIHGSIAVWVEARYRYWVHRALLNPASSSP
jgi:UDP-GlcNAc:undecaprenyl-phosphate/decaprenyl-phosphate GlcNAc-1-phosphate transferase